MASPDPVTTFNVFLCIICCILAVASVDPQWAPACVSYNCTIVCDTRQLAPPSPSRIRRDVRELSYTGYNLGVLDTVELVGGNLSDVVKLNLSGNGITGITNTSFSRQDFPGLKTLILENNNIDLAIDMDSTEPTVFGGLPTLLDLNLKNALNATFCKAGNFSIFFKRATFRLRRLVLSSNDFVLINPDLLASRSTRDLERLEVSHAGLIVILDGTFTRTNLPNLQLLDLSFNDLATITEQNVADFKTFNASATKLNLTGNPFKCICSLHPFVEWVKQTRLVADRTSLLCQGTGVRLVDTLIECAPTFRPEEDAGRGMPSQYVTITITFAVIGVLALVILFMRRNDIWQFCLRVRQATKEAFNSHQTHYSYSGIQHTRRETTDSGVASVDL